MGIHSKKEILQKNNRSIKYKKNIVLLFLSQFLSLITSLLLVSVTLEFLGIEEYGIWITLTTLVSWFAFFDIGLGHGLRNKYAEAKTHNNFEDVKKYVSTAFFIFLAIGLFIFICYAIASPFINLSKILNAPESLNQDLSILAYFVVGMFCIRFVVNIVCTLLIADQKPGIPVFMAAIGNVFSLIAVYWITKISEPSLLYIGIALTATQLFPLTVLFFYYFLTSYKSIYPSIRDFSKPHIRSVFSLGFRFFLIQITALVLFQSNNIIVAHICGPTEVSEFNITYKYLNVLFLIFSSFVNPLWSASTEAYIKNDIAWIHNSIKKLNQIWFGLVLLGVILVILSPLAYKLWLKNTLTPDFILLGLFLFYFIFLCRSFLYRNFMNGVSKISLQFYVTILQAILHIPLTIVSGKFAGLYGITAVMVLWAVTNSIWEPIQFKKIITNTAKGIWNK